MFTVEFSVVNTVTVGPTCANSHLYNRNVFTALRLDFLVLSGTTPLAVSESFSEMTGLANRGFLDRDNLSFFLGRLGSLSSQPSGMKFGRTLSFGVSSVMFQLFCTLHCL